MQLTRFAFAYRFPVRQPQARSNPLMDKFVNFNGYVDISSFSRGSQCILGSPGANEVSSVVRCYKYSYISRNRAKFSSKSH